MTENKTVTAELSFTGIVGGIKTSVSTLLFVLHTAQKAKAILPDSVDKLVNELVTVLTEAQGVLNDV